MDGPNNPHLHANAHSNEGLGFACLNPGQPPAPNPCGSALARDRGVSSAPLRWLVAHKCAPTSCFIAMLDVASTRKLSTSRLNPTEPELPQGVQPCAIPRVIFPKCHDRE
jgi:hypothetical protein